MSAKDSNTKNSKNAEEKQNNNSNNDSSAPERTILVIGGNGTVGGCVVTKLKAFATKYNKNIAILIGGRNSGDIKVDIANSDSIRAMFENELCSNLTDIVNCAGKSLFGHAPTRAAMTEAYQSKVFGQMELCIMANKYFADTREDRSLTLTSGYMFYQSVPTGWGSSAQNAAVNAFVKASVVEMTPNIRVNVVSPGLLTESEASYGAYFPGLKSIAGDSVADAYLQSIFQRIRGKVLYIDNPENAIYK